MPELSVPQINADDPAPLDIPARVAQSNKHMLDLMVGAQRIILEEFVFAGNEFLDRARTETHLFTEFISKVAGVHSVKGMQTMLEECGQHQLDFVRRDCERMFRHGQHMMDTSFTLINQRWKN
jgi:hypothetical protein